MYHAEGGSLATAVAPRQIKCDTVSFGANKETSTLKGLYRYVVRAVKSENINFRDLLAPCGEYWSQKKSHLLYPCFGQKPADTFTL